MPFPIMSAIESRGGKPATMTIIVPPAIILTHGQRAHKLPSSAPHSVISGICHFIRILFLYTGSLSYETKMKTVEIDIGLFLLSFMITLEFCKNSFS